MKKYKDFFYKYYNYKLSSNFRYYSNFFDYKTKIITCPEELKQLNEKLFSEIKNVVSTLQINEHKLNEYIKKVESKQTLKYDLPGINWWKHKNWSRDDKITGIIINNLDMLSKNFNSHKRLKYNKPKVIDKRSQNNIKEKITKQFNESGIKLIDIEYFNKYIKEKIIGESLEKNQILNIWITYIICAKLIKNNKENDFKEIFKKVSK